MKQTIIGAGGSVGTDLARELKQFTDEIRLVGRNPKRINPEDELFQADVTDASQLMNAVAGSQVCYLVLGFDYNIKVWREKWPPLIKNIVEACMHHQCKLVFFDNVYAIGGDNIRHITESSTISPTSKKGEIRAWIDQYILEHLESGKLNAIIARAPDFFGPVKKSNSMMMNTVYDNIVKGKTAQWFCNADVVHTMGYSPDLAKGTAMLGNTPDAFNQIWNLPASPEALTGRQWVKLFADEMKTSDKVQVLPVWMIKLVGLFIPVLREMPEMMYQFDRPYIFDSSKFCNRFNFSPTSNIEAVRMTINALKNQS